MQQRLVRRALALPRPLGHVRDAFKELAAIHARPGLRSSIRRRQGAGRREAGMWGLAPAQVVQRPAPDLWPCSRRDHPITTDLAQPPRHDPGATPISRANEAIASALRDGSPMRRASAVHPCGAGTNPTATPSSAHMPVRAAANASGSGGIVG